MDTSIFNTGLAVASPLVFVAGALCAAVGLGGGGLFIAIFVVAAGMTSHAAVPLSFWAVFGVSTGSFFVLMRQRHPKRDRPSIDYLLCLVMEPLTLLGAVFGVLLNATFPDVIITIMLVLVLAVSGWRTVVKGLSLYKTERVAPSSSSSESTTLLAGNAAIQTRDDSATLSPVAQSIVARERFFPRAQFAALLLMWCTVTALLVVRGGDPLQRSAAGVACGSWQFWSIVGGVCCFLFLFTAGVAVWVRRLVVAKESANYPFLASDPRFTARQLLVWPAFSLLVGLLAGFVGIGGGLLQGPLLLEMGINPAVATATTSFLVLFTSSSAALQFLVAGQLDWRLGLWYYGVGLFAALAGQFAIDAVLQRYKRRFIVVFLLAAVIVMSGAVMCAFNVVHIVRGDANFAFGSPCRPAS